MNPLSIISFVLKRIFVYFRVIQIYVPSPTTCRKKEAFFRETTAAARHFESLISVIYTTSPLLLDAQLMKVVTT